MHDREMEHLHSLELMDELDKAQTSDLMVDARAHLKKAIQHMDLIIEHIYESLDLIETSGARRDAEKARDNYEMAANLARAALDGPDAKMMAALQECIEYVTLANRQLYRAGQIAAI